MKLLKYNILLLEKQKVIYFILCALMIFSLSDILIVFMKNYTTITYAENCPSANELSILTYPFLRIAPFLIFGLPLLFNVLLADSTWMELKQGNSTFIHTRMDYMKNILIRYFLSVVLVFLLSCFCFFINYIALSIIFGNGDVIRYDVQLPFIGTDQVNWFLYSVKNDNPILYSILLILHSSLLYALLAGISYALSFLFKKRIMIYFSSIIFIIFVECITMILKIGNLSIMLQLQPNSVFNVSDAFLLYFLLFLFGIGTLCVFLFQKKDLLL